MGFICNIYCIHELREYTFVFFGLFILSTNVNVRISSYLLYVSVLRATSNFCRHKVICYVRKEIFSHTEVILDVVFK